MKIYDAENRLIQMVSLTHAQEKYADILERIDAEAVPLDLSRWRIEEKEG
jgi:hypothetical protein